MAELVCVAFPKRDEADRVLDELQQLQKQYLVDLADAVVVLRHPDGEVKIKQSVNLAGPAALSGGAWGGLMGMLVGLLFFNPLAGLIAGGAAGAGLGGLSGALTDYGIDDGFIKELGWTISPDSSALFLLVRSAKPDRLMEELKGTQGTLLRTSLSREQEDNLRRMLDDNRKQFDSAAA